VVLAVAASAVFKGVVVVDRLVVAGVKSLGT
jgi:hypothetical protein